MLYEIHLKKLIKLNENKDSVSSGSVIYSVSSSVWLVAPVVASGVFWQCGNLQKMETLKSIILFWCLEYV